MVVDDEEIRDLTQQALRDEGYDAHGTAAGAEASAMLDAATWDVVVADTRACELDAEVLVLDDSFILDELVVRVAASLADQSGWMLRVGDLELDPVAGDVRLGTELLELTPTEFRLLRFLMRHRGRALAKERILAHVWPHDFRGDRSVVETYVSYLRRKIDRGGEPLIHTVRGYGFTIRTPGS